MERCPICNEAIENSSITGDNYTIKCLRCGEYNITGSAFAITSGGRLYPRAAANISAWLNENRGFQINSDNLGRLQQIKTPSFHERADKILLALEKKTTYVGEYHQRDISWVSLGWCINDDELLEILLFLDTSVQRIARESRTLQKYHRYKITAEGWHHLEELKKVNADLKQGFVAMWFDEGMRQLYYDVIAPAILDAGYKPHRVDQREHNNKIDDEIIAEIRRSRFVLADFTGHRGGVYFEAGFAKGLGLEVFWTCRKDEIDKLHFDIRQYNCIDWEPDKLEDFKKRITNRIESVIGRGTYRVER